MKTTTDSEDCSLVALMSARNVASISGGDRRAKRPEQTFVGTRFRALEKVCHEGSFVIPSHDGTIHRITAFTSARVGGVATHARRILAPANTGRALRTEFGVGAISPLQGCHSAAISCHDTGQATCWLLSRVWPVNRLNSDATRSTHCRDLRSQFRSSRTYRSKQPP